MLQELLLWSETGNGQVERSGGFTLGLLNRAGNPIKTLPFN